ncbi:DUF2490 domain-containing protein [Hymenobacter sp. BT664]|uniref:DUF2490 domain-containing protein n=1 Tax=Hymenobacter montanus TaxID=2771359 RepID=A0A927BBD7_9BACT|nr:DUF2490 domain-containing protein [Hymenobacter montanus]MBD2767059.1 DUF2490 domain-containing protein [Hymenobacter montanus]
MLLSRPVFFALFGLLWLNEGAWAQTSAAAGTPWGNWFVGTVVLPGGTRKWGGFVEVQARTNSLFQEYFYNELKGGVSYDLDPNFTVLVGGGRYATYQPSALGDGPLSIEKRLWEQLVLSQFLTRLKLEHRYRVEQRWFSQRDGADVFRQRIRYRLNAFVPLNQKSIAAHTVFLSVYDEIFLNPVGPTFERNRIYAGVGYQLNAHWIGQAGWVKQANFSTAAFQQGIFTPPATSAKNSLVLALTYRLSPRRPKTDPQSLPSQQD